MREKSRGRPVQEGRQKPREGGGSSVVELLSFSERGKVDASFDRVLRIRETGRDFTGIRKGSSERGKGRKRRKEGEYAGDAGQDSFHTTHSGEHASFAGNRIRGSRKTMR